MLKRKAGITLFIICLVGILIVGIVWILASQAEDDSVPALSEQMSSYDLSPTDQPTTQVSTPELPISYPSDTLLIVSNEPGKGLSRSG